MLYSPACCILFFLPYVGDKAESMCFSWESWHLNEMAAFLSLKKIKGVTK